MSTKDADSESGDGVECPTCGRDDFSSESGMKSHHTLKHGESIAGVPVECAWCGEEKRVSPHYAQRSEQHFCDEECHGAWLSKNRTGKDAPGWGGGKVTVECAWCGEEKQVTPHRAQRNERHFCNRECNSAWNSENLSGEDTPRWAGGKVTVECAWCGEEKQVYPSETQQSERHFCSRECEGSWKSENRAGENAPGWKGGKITVECAWCGEEKQVRPHRTQQYERIFCNSDCRSAWQSEVWVGENHPSWVGGKVTVECAWCGREKQTPIHAEKEYERHFCNDECMGAWRSENLSGKNAPSWEGGSFLYGEGWSEPLKEQVRERQDRQCAGCGTHGSEQPRKLDVHHIQKARSFDDAEQRNDDSILVALCRSCHSTWEAMTPLRPQTPYLD